MPCPVLGEVLPGRVVTGIGGQVERPAGEWANGMSAIGFAQVMRYQHPKIR